MKHFTVKKPEHLVQRETDYFFILVLYYFWKEISDSF